MTLLTFFRFSETCQAFSTLILPLLDKAWTAEQEQFCFLWLSWERRAQTMCASLTTENSTLTNCGYLCLPLTTDVNRRHSDFSFTTLTDLITSYNPKSCLLPLSEDRLIKVCFPFIVIELRDLTHIYTYIYMVNNYKALKCIQNIHKRISFTTWHKVVYRFMFWSFSKAQRSSRSKVHVHMSAHVYHRSIKWHSAFCKTV